MAFDIRAQIDHPIIDSDGHTLEFLPAVLEHLEQIGGRGVKERFMRSGDMGAAMAWYESSPEARLDQRSTRPAWWGSPTKNTLDRATAQLPRLLHKRLDEIGIDFSVIFPTMGILATTIEDEEVRRASCRAFNSYHSEVFGAYADRLTPAAVIPMHTPGEAIEALDHAVGDLGMKATLFASHVRRPIPAAARISDEVGRYGTWLDFFGLDSAYDYDPVWARCLELGVSPAFHSTGMGWDARHSTSNYMFNHIGHFAAAGDAICKSLFLGGVTRRFPRLKFAFLEGGVGWACSLFSDLVGHWEKRNRAGIENYDPANIDGKLLRDLFERYGEKVHREGIGRLTDSAVTMGSQEDPSTLDEWTACGIERKEDIRDLFVENFYFGCEADDPINAWAFRDGSNPFDARLRAIFSSDIGHWDVPDMREVTEEAYELVDRGQITKADFRDFVFENPANFWTALNPSFFEGTAVESEVRQHLASN